jgi:putative ABC transport system ATP-binding protein
MNNSTNPTTGNTQSMNILEAHQVIKTYKIGEQDVHVLNNISLTIQKGEFVALIGSSGSGKSTLLSLLSGLDNPTAGRIVVNGQDITHKSEDELAPLRNQTIGFVFQSFHLVPALTALENIMFPAELLGDRQALAKAEVLMRRVGVWERRDNFPHQLSGGERQRVAICRALINNPQILFADEPTGNLDSTNGEAILDLLLQLQKEREMTLILVTHDPLIAQRAGRIIRLKDGQVAL